MNMGNEHILESQFSNGPVITTQPRNGKTTPPPTTPPTPPATTAPMYGILSQDFVQLLKNGDYSDIFTLLFTLLNS